MLHENSILSKDIIFVHDYNSVKVKDQSASKSQDQVYIIVTMSTLSYHLCSIFMVLFGIRKGSIVCHASDVTQCRTVITAKKYGSATYL